MRTLRVIMAVSLFSALNAAASDNSSAAGLSSLPVAAQANVSAALGRDSAEYYAHPVSGGFESNSRGLATRFTSTGVEVSNGNARWGLTLRGWGYGDALRKPDAAAPQATKNRVEYGRGAMTEWYVNGPAGLEQGFTIKERPGKTNGQPLTIALETSGDLTAVADSETGLVLKATKGREAFRYAGLTAYDADGRELHASLRVEGQQVLLQVDDHEARYPVVVDPVVQLAKLTVSYGSSGDGLGVAVAISGNVVVAGTFANAAYVFVKPPTGWKDLTQAAKLTASDGTGTDFLGLSVAVSGNVIVAGAPGVNQNLGAAYVFLKPPTGWKDMTETAKLVASDGAPGDKFGGVAVSGGTVVVGAQDATVNGNALQGAAYVFVKPSGGWAGPDRVVLTEAAKLTASDGGASDFLGNVSISGDMIAVGAFGADKVNGGSKGEAYIFVKPPSGWTSTTETAALKASDDGGFMGQCIATSGNTVAACSIGGVAGKVYVFVEPNNGWANITETAQLISQGAGWNFASSVAIDGTGHVIAVGAPQGNGHQGDTGAVFVFVEPPTGWQTTDKSNSRVFATDGLFGDIFGTSVAISGKILVAGAPRAQIGSNFAQGAAYVFGRQ